MADVHEKRLQDNYSPVKVTWREFIHCITSAVLFFYFTEQVHMLGSRGDLNFFIITYITNVVLLRCTTHFLTFTPRLWRQKFRQ